MTHTPPSQMSFEVVCEICRKPHSEGHKLGTAYFNGSDGMLICAVNNDCVKNFNKQFSSNSGQTVEEWLKDDNIDGQNEGSSNVRR